MARFTARLEKLRGVAANERSAFVVVNVCVNMLLVLRSYVTMQVLDYRELGLAALLQSIVLLIGAMQFGFLNGGFRLMCSAEGREGERINNLVYSFLGVLALVVVAVAAAALFLLSDGDARLVAAFGAIGGIMALARTWIMNHMVAEGALSRLNKLNLASGIASISVLAFIVVDPLTACLGAVIVQPVVFVAAAILSGRGVLPTRFETPAPLVKAVLRAGFVVFLTGIFLQINLQVERWYVTIFLGLEALGHLYLAILFVTLFQMIPTSLNQIFLPPIVRAHGAGDAIRLRAGLRQFFLLTLAYCAIVGLAVAILAEPVTAFVLPRYLPDLRFLYLLAPGLILFTLSNPFALLFNVLIRYRYYLVSYGGGTLATVAVFGLARATGRVLDLDAVMILRSGVYVLMGAIIVMGFVAMSRSHREFRFPLTLF